MGLGACCSWCGIEGQQGHGFSRSSTGLGSHLDFCGYFSVSAQFQIVKLCCFPSDLPLFCCRSYSSTSIEEAMKGARTLPHLTENPFQSLLLDLNKVFQPSVPGEVPFCTWPSLSVGVSGWVSPQRSLWVQRISRPGPTSVHGAGLSLGRKAPSRHIDTVCLEPCPHSDGPGITEILYPGG